MNNEQKVKQKQLKEIMKLLKKYDPNAMIMLGEKLYNFPVFISQNYVKK